MGCFCPVIEPGTVGGETFCICEGVKSYLYLRSGDPWQQLWYFVWQWQGRQGRFRRRRCRARVVVVRRSRSIRFSSIVRSLICLVGKETVTVRDVVGTFISIYHL